MKYQKRQPHKVWQVRIGSHEDRSPGQLLIHLPTRATYIIEAKGQGTVACRRALKMAEADGISRPVVLSLQWLNNSVEWRT